MVLHVRGTSSSLKKGRIPKDRRCAVCGSPEAHGDWSKIDDKYFMCSSCHTAAERADRKRAQDESELDRVRRKAVKILFDPNYKPPPPKHCVLCHSTTTRIRYRNGYRYPKPLWYEFGSAGDVQCDKCYDKQHESSRTYRGLAGAWKKELKASNMFPAIRRPTAAERRAKRRVLNPSMHFYVAPFEAPKRCGECGKTTTSKNTKGKDNWYRLEVPIGPVGYLDNNCYRKRERRVKREAKDKG
jgi:hypothetical protein